MAAGGGRRTGPDRPRYSAPPFARIRRDELELIHEVTATAAAIAAARDFAGEPVVRGDARWRMLCAIECSRWCLSIADLARDMRISRQAAQQLAIAGERAGDIELLYNPDDRRIRQLQLTGKGKAELERSRSRERTWVAALLNGLGRHEMRATTHILRVIRHRLLRDDGQRASRARA
jgi:DNA-binding MarR family transcriptional regulator